MQKLQLVASRVVSSQLQEQFADLSGDRNPMHMDPIAARRTQAGLPVVHGVHTMLWALESLVTSKYIVSPLTRIRAKFTRWVHLGDEANLILPVDEQADPKTLQVRVLDMPVLSAELSYGEAESSEPSTPLVASPAMPLSHPLDLSFEDMNERSGNAFTTTEETARRLFPAISAAIGSTAVAEIAACSYVVGMEAPGLHSMLSKLDLKIAKSSRSIAVRTALRYVVASHDFRFRKARIAVTGQNITGEINVFVRVPPVAQVSMEEVAAYVKRSEFAGMRALIIGGSRGLGEVTAKLIAAGGGIATITYSLGKADAEEIARQIRDWGGDTDTLPYDVCKAPQSQLDALSQPPTHLFYFATNTIYKPKQGVFSLPVLQEFIQFYVRGFYDLCAALSEVDPKTASANKRLVVFYPSTAFIEQRPPGMTEYAMAKAAGEQMCADMNRALPRLHVVTRRLQRLLTDQTAGVIPQRDLSAVLALLPVVREMQALSNQC